jgi:hypothetical protein
MTFGDDKPMTRTFYKSAEAPGSALLRRAQQLNAKDVTVVHSDGAGRVLEAAKPVVVRRPTMRFVCCTHEFLVGDALRLDDEGFFVCPVHGQRRYGWLTSRKAKTKAHPFNPADPQFILVTLWGETHLARDREVVSLWLKDNDVAGTPMKLNDKQVERISELAEEEADLAEAAVR